MASDAAITTIKIPVWLWASMIFDLRRRGGGVRESGAFLLGRDDGDPARVSNYICYDDVDPDAYQQGAIAFHADGCAALWRHCRAKQLQLLIDVHTHPGPDVRQSSIDERHPMLPVVGPHCDDRSEFREDGVGGRLTPSASTSISAASSGTRTPPSAPGRRVKLSLW